MTRPTDTPVPGAGSVARNIIALLPQPTCLVDGEGRVAAANVALAELLGIPGEELRGRHIRECVKDDAETVDRVLGMWRGSSGWRPGGLHLRGPATDTPLHCRGARLPGSELLLVEVSEQERAVADFVALSREVELANLRRMEARLQESLAELGAVNQRLEAANAELDRYASMVAHDIRTPFNAIGRFVDLVLGDHELPDEATEMLQAVARLAERGEEVTEALLSLARTGDAELVPEGTDSNAVAARVRRDLEPEIAAAGGEVTIEDLPETAVQPVHLERVLSNLLSNALKYVADDRPPRVVVTGEPAGALVRFTVMDNGLGIPEEERERVFEPMARGAAGIGRPGTGVGLTTCRKIVGAYGGEIGVVERPGTGTTVAFTLPAADPQAARSSG